MPQFEEISGNPALCMESWRQKHGTWGSPFTMEQWERVVSAMGSISAKHGMNVLTFAVFEGENLVAGCEVLERSLYIGGGKHAKDYGVAAVHTSAKHRQKGYANVLIDGVVSKFKNDESSQLSLWSDVGDYYARMGFKMLPGDEHLTLSVLASQELPTKKDPHMSWIDTAEKISEFRTKHNAALLKLADTTGGQIVEATAGVYELATARSSIYKETLGEPAPNKFGACLNGSWLTWCYQYGSKRILILGGDGTASELAQLFIAATETASKEGLEKVDVHETTFLKPLVKDIKAELEHLGVKSELSPRKNNLPMQIGKKNWVGAGGYCWY